MKCKNTRSSGKTLGVAPSLYCSVARWLSPKPAKSCHEKLLDPAKNHVTKF